MISINTRFSLLPNNTFLFSLLLVWEYVAYKSTIHVVDQVSQNKHININLIFRPCCQTCFYRKVINAVCPSGLKKQTELWCSTTVSTLLNKGFAFVLVEMVKHFPTKTPWRLRHSFYCYRMHCTRESQDHCVWIWSKRLELGEPQCYDLEYNTAVIALLASTVFSCTTLVYIRSVCFSLIRHVDSSVSD